MLRDYKIKGPAPAKKKERYGIAWLELLLSLACVMLVLQLFPILWITLLRVINIRNWTRGVWMSLNVGVVLALIGFRFGPELFDDCRKWSRRRSGEGSVDDKRLSMKEERALYERMREARKRQVI